MADGPAADHLIGFDRGGAITLATRLPVGLAKNGWADTTVRIPAGSYLNVLTGAAIAGGVVDVADVLAELPVALLLETTRA